MVIVFIRFWKDVIQPLRPFCRDCIWHRHLPLLSSSQHWLHGQCSSELKAHEMSGPGVLVPVLITIRVQGFSWYSTNISFISETALLSTTAHRMFCVGVNLHLPFCHMKTFLSQIWHFLIPLSQMELFKFEFKVKAEESKFIDDWF